MNFLFALFRPITTLAQRYGGGGLTAGASQAANVVGNNDVRGVIVNLLVKALSFMALAAVVVIVIAGIILVTSAGEEGKKDQAKKMILFALIGLFIIVIARVLVIIVINA